MSEEQLYSFYTFIITTVIGTAFILFPHEIAILFFRLMIIPIGTFLVFWCYEKIINKP
jgi:hypothetical protein